MSTLRFRVSGYLKERVMSFYGIPFSRHGLEPYLVPFIKPGQPITLLDVGASNGTFANLVDCHAGIREALLIEPQPQRCRELRERFDSRFTIRQCAASDVDESAEMDILNFDYSSSLLPLLPEVGGFNRMVDANVRERITVQCRRIDDVLDEAGFNGPIDLFKIDVQGAELSALRGARRALARTSLLWTEVSFRPMYEGSAVFADIYQFFQSEGFTLCSLQQGFRSEDGELLQADALFRPLARLNPGRS